RSSARTAGLKGLRRLALVVRKRGTGECFRRPFWAWWPVCGAAVALSGCLGSIDGEPPSEGPRLLAEGESWSAKGDGPGAFVPDASVLVGPDAGAEPDGAMPAEPDAGVGPGPEPSPVRDPVPAGAHCEPVAYFGAARTALEDEVLRLTNQHRAAGASCGSEGTFGPAPALSMNAALRCAARLHSLDMDTRNFFAHTNPSGVTFDQRMTAAGYTWGYAGENILKPVLSAAAMVDAWMNSPGHCRNIMDAGFVDIGVGISTGNATQDFGRRL
ncbi:MAG: CAP domain-containing protein, partial [Myxococcales bacterium]|nr:CAP domain-containing protein [Myxococcales bacterium]